MVVTVTFNPALDYIVYLPELRPGSLGRAVKETIVPGGKGLNVVGGAGQSGNSQPGFGIYRRVHRGGDSPPHGDCRL